MSNKIHWSDGSFEFVTKQELDAMPIKQYRSEGPFAMCKYCDSKNCGSNKAVTENVVADIFNKCLDETLDDEAILFSKLKEIVIELRKALNNMDDKNAYSCAFIQLLQLIDEDTILDITDEVAQRLYVAFRTELG